MFTTQDRGLLAVYPGLRYTRGCLAPTNIVHFLFLSFAFYGMMTVAGSGHSSCELIVSLHLEKCKGTEHERRGLDMGTWRGLLDFWRRTTKKLGATVT